MKERIKVSHPPDFHEKREHLSHAQWVNHPPKNIEKEALRASNGIELPRGHMDICLEGYRFASKCGGDPKRSPTAPFPHGEM